MGGRNRLFLRGGQNRRLRIRGTDEEAANNAVEHVSGKPFKLNNFSSDNFKLCINIFIARAKIENAMNQIRN